MTHLPAMRRACARPPRAWLAAFAGLSVVWLAAARGEERINYADHLRPLFQSRCFSCHNPDKKKGGLQLTAYSGVLAGGSGGAVVDAGNHAGSRLWALPAHKQEPFMPPEGDPLKPAELELVAKWIDGGLLETSGSVAKKVERPQLAMVITVTGKPEGPPALPEHVLLEPLLVAERGNAVAALAASPWAPLLAVGGAGQVILYRAEGLELAGIFPYPEGFVSSLRFSRNGALLVAAGGHPALRGNVVLFDVKTGRRVAELGGELDTVLAADLAADHSMVAFGTPGRKLKVCDTAGVELYVKDKHTDWVTAVAFSPDGVLLASGDRGGGLRVWEADTGGEYLNLEAHKGALTALSWRPDSDVLASASEDGEVILWEMNNGGIVKRWTAHGGGTLWVDYAQDGKLVTGGRDRHVKAWKGDGALIKDIAGLPDLPTRVAFLHDNARVAAGNWTGDVTVWTHDTGQPQGAATQNPPALETRIAALERELGALKPQLPPAEQARDAAAQPLAATEKTVAEERKAVADAKAGLARVRADVAETERKLAALRPEQTNAWKAIEAQRAVLRGFDQSRLEAAEVERRLAEARARADELRKQITDAGGDAARVDLLKPRLAPLEQAEKELAAQAEKARQAIATPPAPLASLAQRVQEADHAVTELESGTKQRTSEAALLESSAAEHEKRVAALAPQLEAQRKEWEGRNAACLRLTEDITNHTKAIAALKAAQFNVGVLAEKERLARLEAELNTRRATLAGARAGLSAQEQELAKARALVAQVEKEMPGLEAAAAKLAQEAVGLEAAAAPLRAGLPEISARLEQARRTSAGREQDLKAARQLDEEAKSFKIPAAPEAPPSGVVELDKARQQLVAAEKALAEKALAVAALRAELAARATDAFVAATNQVAEAEAALREHERNLAGAEKSLADKRGEAAAAAAARDRAVANRQAALDAVPKLEQAIAKSRPEAGQAQTAAAEAEQAFTAQKAKVDQLHTQYLALLP